MIGRSGRLFAAAVVVATLVVASPGPAQAQTAGVNGPSSLIGTDDAHGTQAAITFGNVIAMAFAGFQGGHCSSPWENGFGFRGGVELNLSATRHLSLVPSVAYDVLYFDGNQDRFLNFGAQIRRAPDRPAMQKHGFWYGAEITFGQLTEVFTGGSETTGGFLVGGVTGIRIYKGSHGVLDLTGGVGYTHFGSSGIQTRVGVEWRIPK